MSNTGPPHCYKSLSSGKIHVMRDSVQLQLLLGSFPKGVDWGGGGGGGGGYASVGFGALYTAEPVRVFSG
jgi:hypothetical protein